MDPIELVCYECAFIELGDFTAMESAAVNRIHQLSRIAARAITEFIQKIVAVIRNVINFFRKQKKVYLAASDINYIHRAISTVNKGANIIDELPHLKSVIKLEDADAVIRFSQPAYDAASSLRELNTELRNILKDQSTEFDYRREAPHKNKLVEYKDYAADRGRLIRIESKMNGLLEEAKTADAEFENITKKYANLHDTDFGKYSEKIASETGSNPKAAPLIGSYYHAYGTAVKYLLYIVNTAQLIFNNAIRAAQLIGYKKGNSIERNQDHKNPFVGSDTSDYNKRRK